MKINKIELKNFKFHHDLEFDIKEKSCLIYGENGTGKSSIYDALYSNFYYFKNVKIARGQIDIREKFRHRDYEAEALKVNILFDNDEYLNREDNDLDNHELLEAQSIYFANERVLREITENDFYFIIGNFLIEHFPQLEELRLYDSFETKLRRLKTKVTSEIIQERIDLDTQFKERFDEYIPLEKINTILKDDFDEKFQIEFDIIDSFVENKKLIYPTISIKIQGIEDRGDFQNHFNEAKLKLISIAIYFALAKKYETESELKLLVLDDFLTSLDMANRKLIVQYILDNFSEYQKIILTHNIQFYNLIVKLLKMRKKDEENEELTDWDIKNIFLREIENKELSIITDREEDYLKKAKDELDNYHLEISGNFLRKEFERTATEFEQLLELGRVEELDKILKALASLDYVFIETPSKILYNSFPKQIKYIQNILNNSGQDNTRKVQQFSEAINNFEASIILKKKPYDTSYLKSILLKTEFYKDILMNSASHDDPEKELHQKEFKKAIELLKALKKMLNDLK